MHRAQRIDSAPDFASGSGGHFLRKRFIQQSLSEVTLLPLLRSSSFISLCFRLSPLPFSCRFVFVAHMAALPSEGNAGPYLEVMTWFLQTFKNKISQTSAVGSAEPGQDAVQNLIDQVTQQLNAGNVEEAKSSIEGVSQRIRRAAYQKVRQNPSRSLKTAWLLNDALIDTSGARVYEVQREKLTVQVKRVAEELYYCPGKGQTFVKDLIETVQEKCLYALHGCAGLGKTILAEKLAEAIASNPYTSTGSSSKGKYIVLNARLTLTEEALMESRDVRTGSVLWGPARYLIEEANLCPDSRFVLVIHEYNRVTDPMSVFGTLFEMLLARAESYGNTAIQISGSGAEMQEVVPLRWPDNFYIIFTGNPGDGAHDVALFDEAMKNNRMMGRYEDLSEKLGWNGDIGSNIVHNFALKKLSYEPEPGSMISNLGQNPSLKLKLQEQDSASSTTLHVYRLVENGEEGCKDRGYKVQYNTEKKQWAQKQEEPEKDVPEETFLEISSQGVVSLKSDTISFKFTDPYMPAQKERDDFDAACLEYKEEWRKGSDKIICPGKAIGLWQDKRGTPGGWYFDKDTRKVSSTSRARTGRAHRSNINFSLWVRAQIYHHPQNPRFKKGTSQGPHRADEAATADGAVKNAVGAEKKHDFQFKKGFWFYEPKIKTFYHSCGVGFSRGMPEKKAEAPENKAEAPEKKAEAGNTNDNSTYIFTETAIGRMQDFENDQDPSKEPPVPVNLEGKSSTQHIRVRDEDFEDSWLPRMNWSWISDDGNLPKSMVKDLKNDAKREEMEEGHKTKEEGRAGDNDEESVSGEDEDKGGPSKDDEEGESGKNDGECESNENDEEGISHAPKRLKKTASHVAP